MKHERARDGDQLRLMDGIVRRDQALSRAEDAADRRWFAKALFIIETWRMDAYPSDEFTTDSLWRVLDAHGLETHEPRAMGAVMMEAKRRGWIEPTGRYQKSTRPECHARPIMVWKLQKERG